MPHGLSVIEETSAGVHIRVFIQPQSSQNQIIGPHNDELKIKLTAPPVDGEANAGLIQLIAKLFKIPKRNIRIVKGLSSRHKTLALEGVTTEQAKKILGVS